MGDKHSIKYNAYIDKESGEIVCQQLNCNYSIQVYDMAQNMSAIYINTSPNPQSQIEFFANNSTNPASQTYSNCNLGINENNFYLYNMNGGTIWNTDLLANISTFYMPLNVADTFTADNVSINETLTVSTIVPTANGTGSIGTGDLTFYNAYINHAYLGFIDTLVYMQDGASFYGPIQILNPVSGDTVFTLTVNNGNQLNFASVGQTNPITIDAGSNTMNLPSGLTVSGTITGTSIQLNVTGSNPQGLSIIGVTGTTPSDDATQIFFQSNASGTITTHWQLGPNYSTADPPDFWLYNNIGNYNTLQIHASTPLIDVISSINITGSVTISETLTAQQIICSPATQGAALHIYGDADYSAELAFMTGSDKLFEVGTTTTNVVTGTGNFFFIYNNQNSTYFVQIITGSPQTINLNGNVNNINTLTANTINATTINPNNTVSSVTGSESGSIIALQPFTGSGYKKVVF